MDRNLLQPYEEHFHPVVKRSTTKKPEHRRLGYPFVAVNIIPHADQVCPVPPSPSVPTRYPTSPSGYHPGDAGKVGLLPAPALRP